MAFKIEDQKLRNQLRVGIAGYGLAGRYFHAPLLKGCGYEVSGVLTNDGRRAQQAMDDFPNVKVVSTIQDLVSLPLDLLVLAAVNKVHAELAIAGLNAGIPVVVDKPMGRNLEETQQMISTSERLEVPITVFYNRRWDSDSLTVKRILQEGLLGEIFRMDSRFERFRPSIATSSWREKSSSEEGGGILLDLQSHLVSTSLDLFGPAGLVYSSIRSIRGGSDDDAVLVLKHDSGVDSYLSASAIVGAPGPRLRLVGSKGALIIEDLDPQEALLRAGNFPEGGQWSTSTKSRAFLHHGTEVIEVVGEDGNYPIFYQLVAGAIEGTNPWPVSNADALAVASIIDNAREISVR